MKSMNVPSIIKVIGANAAAVGITLTEVNEWLKTISILIAIGYGLYKWITDIRERRKVK